jgi:hypothetical protein
VWGSVHAQDFGWAAPIATNARGFSTDANSGTLAPCKTSHRHHRSATLRVQLSRNRLLGVDATTAGPLMRVPSDASVKRPSGGKGVIRSAAAAAKCLRACALSN